MNIQICLYVLTEFSSLNYSAFCDKAKWKQKILIVTTKSQSLFISILYKMKNVVQW